MVDANLQRETILPSERAYAYKMKLAAIRHQGKREDITCAQVGHKLRGKRSRDILAEQSGQSRNQVSRYIRLTELIPEILEMVDQRKIAMNPAVSISFLAPKQQKLLYGVMTTLKTTPSIAQAKIHSPKSSRGRFQRDVFDRYFIRKETKSSSFPSSSALVQEAEIKQYFPAHYNKEQMHNTILLLVRNWSKSAGTQITNTIPQRADHSALFLRQKTETRMITAKQCKEMCLVS